MNSEENENDMNKKELTYHFSHNIERVWLIVRDFQYILFLNKWENYVPINIKGLNTFHEGNEFYGIIFGKLLFYAKVKKYFSIPQIKKIKWEINFKIENKNYSSKLSEKLYKVTENDSCVYLFKFKGNNKIFNILEKIKPFNLNMNDIFDKINEILCNSTDISQYEGGIISGKMDDIWEFILNTIKLKKIAPLIHLDGEIDLNKINEGDEIQMFYDNHNKNFMIKCKLKEKKDNWNKWFIIFHLFSGNPKIPEQELIIELTKINNKDCQLILFTKYFEPEINENIQKISQNKKYIINSIKDYLENYKCY